MSPSILVTGAGGHVGPPVVAAGLRAAAMSVPAATRAAKDAVPAGAEHVAFDAIDRATLTHVVSFLLQNLSAVHRRGVPASRSVVPAGRGRTTFYDALDVADVAVAALKGKAAPVGRAWTPTGGRALSYDEGRWTVPSAALTTSGP